jgi:hypothetical protein
MAWVDWPSRNDDIKFTEDGSSDVMWADWPSPQGESLENTIWAKPERLRGCLIP